MQGPWVQCLVREPDPTCHDYDMAVIPCATTKSWCSQINKNKYIFFNAQTRIHQPSQPLFSPCLSCPGEKHQAAIGSDVLEMAKSPWTLLSLSNPISYRSCMHPLWIEFSPQPYRGEKVFLDETIEDQYKAEVYGTNGGQKPVTREISLDQYYCCARCPNPRLGREKASKTMQLAKRGSLLLTRARALCRNQRSGAGQRALSPSCYTNL